MGYVILILLMLGSFALLFRSPFKTGLSLKHLAIGWSIKLLFTASYSYIFIFYYSNGNLDLDLYNFYHDSKEVSEYGKKDPVGYLELLSGIGGDDEKLLQNELKNTDIWDYPGYGDLLNDNRLLIRINSVVHFFSFGNVYVHIFIMSFLAWLGLLMLYKAFKPYVKNHLLLFYVLAAFPTIAFWSSGFNKEALLFFAIGLYFLNLFSLIKEVKFKSISGLLIAVAILILNKPHVGLIVIPCSLVLLTGLKTNWNPKVLWGWTALILLAGIGFTFTPPKINLVARTTQKQNDLINVAHGGVFFINDTAFCAFDYQYVDHFKRHENDKIEVLRPTKGEYKLFGKNKFHPFKIHPDTTKYDLYLIQVPANSYVNVTPINYSRKQLLLNIPSALINVFVRPLPRDPGSSMKYFAFVGNIFFLGLIGFVLFKRRAIEKEEKYLIYTLISSALLIALLIGWTTPILGAVVRYKCAVDLLLILALMIILKPIKKL